MQLHLYDITVPPLIRGLRILDNLLDRGRAHADSTGMAHDDMLGARLIDDMMTLTQQVQRASDTSKLAAVRLGDVANIPMTDNETSFDQLKERIAATIAFLQDVPSDAINDNADKEVTMSAGSNQRQLSARDYALQFALPNFFFHLTTAYDILRHKGVPVGKRDYLGWA